MEILTREIIDGSRQCSVFAVNASFMLVTGLIVGFRTWIKLRIVKHLGIDDILAVVSVVIAYGLSGASMSSAYYGTGKHIWQIAPSDMKPYLQSIYVTRVLYVLGLLSIKLSILLLYLRLDPRKSYRIAVGVILFVVVGLSVPSEFVVVFSCIPPSMFWDTTVEGKCLNSQQIQIFYDTNGALNIFTDVAIYVFPIPMLWDIRLPGKQKLALTALLSVGIVAVVAGCVRFAYVHRLQQTTDNTYELADALNWCVIELYVAIICSSAPSFKAFIKRYIPNLLSTSRQATYPTSSLTGRKRRDYNPADEYPLGQIEASRRMETTITGMQRNESEEMIIPAGADVIVTRSEITVETEDVETEIREEKKFSGKSGKLAVRVKTDSY